MAVSDWMPRLVNSDLSPAIALAIALLLSLLVVGLWARLDPKSWY